MEANRVSAVILDLDGTLLDTERATSGILKEFLERYGKFPDAKKEEKRLGQMHNESSRAIVRDYELPLTAQEFSEAIMPLYKQRWLQAKPLPGVNRLIRHLHKHGIPLGLASNSMRSNIETKISHQKGWKEYFSVILGGDEVENGKPSPDIFLEAAKRLGVKSSSCLVIEDSPVGVRAAKDSGAIVIAIPSLQGQTESYSIANLILNSLLDLKPELWGLPPFDDWVQNALPTEPLVVTRENNSFKSIPDQVSGIFFGWAESEANGLYEVVISTGWDLSFGTPKRVMRQSLLDHDQHCMNEYLQLLLVGYIRKLQNEGNMTDALEITEEDKRIARAALDLPIFSHCSNSNLFE